MERIVTAVVSVISTILSLVTLGIGITHIRFMRHLIYNMMFDPFMGGGFGGGYGGMNGHDDFFGGCSGWGDNDGYGMNPWMLMGNPYMFMIQFWRCRLLPGAIAIVAISGALALIYLIAAVLGGLGKLGKKGTIGVMAAAILFEIGSLVAAIVVMRRVYHYIPGEFHTYDRRLYTTCILAIIKFIFGLVGGGAAIGLAVRSEKS